MGNVAVWAPLAHRGSVRISEPGRSRRGWHGLTPLDPTGRAGSRPRSSRRSPWPGLRLPARRRRDASARPSLAPPASGRPRPSRFYDSSFAWTDSAWAGKDCPTRFIYELHLGTFTAEGTLNGAAREIGTPRRPRHHPRRTPARSTTSTESGTGATTACSGTPCMSPTAAPTALKRFVDACHARGLAVILDVVYNHLGAEWQRPAAVRPLPQGRAATPGVTWSTWTADLPAGS